MRTLPIMEKKTGLKLHPTYSYARIYKAGDIMLKRHKDRFSCEISTTLNLVVILGLHLEPKKNVGIPDGKKLLLIVIIKVFQ